MWTNAYGATSSSTTIAARGSRRRFRPLTESPHVVNTNSSPSSANHTGITCGCPLGPLVASLAVRVPWMRKARVGVGVGVGVERIFTAADVPLAVEHYERLGFTISEPRRALRRRSPQAPARSDPP